MHTMMTGVSVTTLVAPQSDVNHAVRVQGSGVRGQGSAFSGWMSGLEWRGRLLNNTSCLSSALKTGSVFYERAGRVSKPGSAGGRTAPLLSTKTLGGVLNPRGNHHSPTHSPSGSWERWRPGGMASTGMPSAQISIVYTAESSSLSQSHDKRHHRFPPSLPTSAVDGME